MKHLIEHLVCQINTIAWWATMSVRLAPIWKFYNTFQFECIDSITRLIQILNLITKLKQQMKM